METTDVKGNWHEHKRKLKQQFPILTDGDLLYWDGKQEEMFAKLQFKLGIHLVSLESQDVTERKKKECLRWKRS